MIPVKWSTALLFAALAFVATQAQVHSGGHSPNNRPEPSGTEVGDPDGGLTRRVAVPLPPGPEGLAPLVELRYSSDASNGIAGQGWSYPMSCITRQRVHAVDSALDGASYTVGAPAYDASDGFAVNGMPLVKCGPPYAGSCSVDTGFRTLQDSFVNYLQSATGWTALGPDGTVRVYGGPLATWTDPQHNEPYRWCLSSEQGRGGHKVQYGYANPNNHPPRLLVVLYGDVEIDLSYEARPDVRVDRQYGPAERYDQRLQRIQVFVSDTSYARYELDYAPTPSGYSGIERDNHLSLLTSITNYGSAPLCSPEPDCADSERYEFRYGGRGGVSIWGPEGWFPFEEVGNPLHDPNGVFVDINGDGFRDVVHGNCQGFDGFVIYGVGGNQFAYPPDPRIRRTVDETTIPCIMNDGRYAGAPVGVHPAYVTGSRIPDFVRSSATEAPGGGFDYDRQLWVAVEEFESNGMLFYVSVPTSSYLSSLPAVRYDGPQPGPRDLAPRFVDLNGDGLQDILISNEYFGLNSWGLELNGAWLNTGSGFVRSPTYESPAFFTAGGEFSQRDLGVYAVDVDHDGLGDLVQSYGILGTDEWFNQVWLNHGADGFVLDANYTASLEGFFQGNPQQARACFVAVSQSSVASNYGCDLVDLNGDGLIDLVQADATLDLLHLTMNDGARFSPDPVGAAFLPPEFLSDRTAGGYAVVGQTFSGSANGPAFMSDYDYMDYRRIYPGGTFPERDRLVEIKNPLGGREFFSYRNANDTLDNPDLTSLVVALSASCLTDGTTYDGSPDYGAQCSRPTDIAYSYSFKGGRQLGRFHGALGFRYVRVTGGDEPGDLHESYHRTEEAWYHNDRWCTRGLEEFSLVSSTANGMAEACEHRDADFGFDASAPQVVIDPGCASADSQILGSVQKRYITDTCVDLPTATPSFVPTVSVISTSYDPAQPTSRVASQLLVDYSAADLARGRSTETCLFRFASDDLTSCTSEHPDQWAHNEYVAFDGWIFDRVCVTQLKDAQGAAFLKRRTFYEPSGSCAPVAEELGDNPLLLPVREEWRSGSDAVLRVSEREYNSAGRTTMLRRYSDHDPAHASFATTLASYYKEVYPRCSAVFALSASGDPCIDGLGISRIDYDELDRPQTITDLDNGTVTSVEAYDTLHRVEHVLSTSVDGHTIAERSTSYENFGNPAMQYVVDQVAFADPGFGPPTLTSQRWIDGLGRGVRAELFSDDPAEGSATRSSYDHRGRIASREEPKYADEQGPRKTFTWAYDRFGRPWKSFEDGFLQTTHTYGIDASRSLILHDVFLDNPAASGGSGEQHRWERGTSLGWLVETGEARSEGNEVNVRYEYDARGRLHRIMLPGTSPTADVVMQEFTRDEFGRPTSVIDADLSNCSTPSTCPWTFDYDDLGRLTKRVDAQGNVQRFVRDDLGRLQHRLNCASATGALQPDRVAAYTFDPAHLGRLTLVRDLDAGALSAYADVCQLADEPDDNLEDELNNILQTQPNVQVETTLTYHPTGRPSGIRVAFDDPGQAAVWSDEQRNYARAEYGGPLRRLTIETSTGAADTRDYSYDGLGRPTQVTSLVAGAGFSGLTYTADGRPLQVNIGPDRLVKSWSYENAVTRDFQRLRGLTFTTPEPSTYHVGYDQFDNVGNVLAASSSFSGSAGVPAFALTKAFTYDVQNELRTYAYRDQATSATYAWGSFNYDDLGNRTSVASDVSGCTDEDGDSHTLGACPFYLGPDCDDHNPAVRGCPAPPPPKKPPLPEQGSRQIRRPNALWLSRGDHASLGGDTVEINDLALAGVAAERDPAPLDAPGFGGPHARHDQGGVTYTYDKNGSLVQSTDATRTVSYSFDANRRLRAVEEIVGGQSTFTTFVNDIDGRRVSVVDGNGNRVTYLTRSVRVVDDGVERAVLDAYEGEVDSGESRHFLRDALGSVVGVTSAAGLVSVKDVLPYGQDWYRYSPASGTDYGFNGNLEEGGLLDYGARHLLPGGGAFLQADTAVPDTSRPLGFHRYAYVYNNPVSWIDPSGHDPERAPFEGLSYLKLKLYLRFSFRVGMKNGLSIDGSTKGGWDFNEGAYDGENKFGVRLSGEARRVRGAGAMQSFSSPDTLGGSPFAAELKTSIPLSGGWHAGVKYAPKLLRPEASVEYSVGWGIDTEAAAADVSIVAKPGFDSEQFRGDAESSMNSFVEFIKRHFQKWPPLVDPVLSGEDPRGDSSHNWLFDRFDRDDAGDRPGPEDDRQDIWDIDDPGHPDRPGSEPIPDPGPDPDPDPIPGPACCDYDWWT